MYSEFENFEALKAHIIEDKEFSGYDISTRNRYPLRFVLFDNFRDCSQFVEFIQVEIGAIVESVEKWLDPEYPDIMITHTELAQKFTEYIKKMKGKDCVIAPFSELARFYDNKEKKTFDALLKTIKAIEASVEGVENNQRVYVPIVGLEGKMDLFSKDSQSTIWRLRASSKELSYRLVLTDKTTFGVKGLKKHYTVVNTMSEWLNVWKDADKQVTPNIICTSHSIYANAVYAQPDNAFSFVTCDNAYKFLTEGLQLQFGGLTLHIEDKNNWDKLAENIDITNGFSFSKYVKDYFLINDIDSYEPFIKLWLDNQGSFERWLLARYYQIHHDAEDYIFQILSGVQSLVGNDFIEKMVLDLPMNSNEIKIRSYCLTEARKRNLVLQEAVESTLTNKLVKIASDHNVTTALKYLTGITKKEKELAISWIGRGVATIDHIKSFFPELYHYMAEPLGVSVNVPSWVSPYIGEYKRAKLANRYTEPLKTQIRELNACDTAFDAWYQEFSTVRTLLNSRGDIEVFYWIDGLGIEWIPLIKEIIREKNDQNIFLNEIKIARSILPTTTSTNRQELLKLLPDGEQLKKAGDLDSLAHQSTNVWPSTIIKEINLVREIIEDILSKYNGKKIAILSDHGLTYMSQLCEGLGYVGVQSDHHGRLAVKTEGVWTADENYIRLEDGKTVCALKHNSLCNKVPKGQGIHGGCTPEEVLVPIFIISSYVAGTEWSAEMMTLELTGANPTVKFRIKNVPTIEIPHVEYDGRSYKLNQVGNDMFETEPLVVNNDCTVLSLVIGNVIRTFNITIQSGVQEDDLFSGF